MTCTIIEVERFERSDDQPSRWRIDPSENGWRVAGPGGAKTETGGDLVEALRMSGSCTFSNGAALRILTTGSVNPFDLFPALEEWLAEFPAGSEDEQGSEELPTWRLNPEFSRLDELSSEDYEALSLDSSRVILIDDDLCGVSAALIGNGPSAIRKRIFVLAECEFMGSLTPKFFDLWATMFTNNGYGWGEYAIGEVSPGVKASFENHEGMKYLFFDPMPSNGELYDDVLSWISGCVASTPQPGTDEGFSGFEVVVEGNDVQIIWPDEGPHVDAGGWIAPKVVARRPLPDAE